MFASSPSESSSPVSARSATPEYETYEGYASYARSPSKDDLFAATTLLAMNSLGIHGVSQLDQRLQLHHSH